MKRVFAGILAVTMAAGMLTACGSVKASHYVYEVDYNRASEIDSSELQSDVEKIIEQVQAIQKGDKDAVKESMNANLGLELGFIDMYDISDYGMDDYFDSIYIERFDGFKADAKKVKKVEVCDEKTEGKYTSVVIKVFFEYAKDDNIIIDANVVKSDSGKFIYVDNAETESKATLKNSNIMAKVGFDTIAEALADMEAWGLKYDGASSQIADVDCTKAPDREVSVSVGATEEYLIYCLQKNLGSYGDDGGYVYVIFTGEETPVCYVQWRETMDSDIIGQYPEVPITADAQVQWGEIYHYD